ncbi:MAG: hypothetical protein K0Q79_1911 [Flavipsychrobacter sp.]|jgi:hypothetical protein|nr:hypothetical protein [Flavipsychrobacter sp.]
MKRLQLLFAILMLSYSSFAQKTVQVRNLWADPNVHVLFQGYVLSFTIKDINRALQLLSERGITTYGKTSGLDTLQQYHLELYPGYRQEYHNELQRIMQLGAGAFLLSKGRAVIHNPKGRKLKNIIIDVQPFEEGEYVTTVKFYDPANDKLIFSGKLAKSMVNADLGIDYW